MYNKEIENLTRELEKAVEEGINETAFSQLQETLRNVLLLVGELNTLNRKLCGIEDVKNPELVIEPLNPGAGLLVNISRTSQAVNFLRIRGHEQLNEILARL